MLMNEVNILLVESSTIDFVFPQINHSEPLPGILSGVLPNLRSDAFRSSGGGKGSGIWVGYIVPTRSQIPIP